MFRKRTPAFLGHDMDRTDLIFTLKMTALGVAGLIAYIVVSYIQER